MKFKTVVKLITILLAGAIALVGYSNYIVEKSGLHGMHYINENVSAETAVILGAKVFQTGIPSTVLKDRLDTGIDLYNSGRVKKLLMTGDHGQVTYDEVNGMRRYAIEKGVPEEDIFMDHAGFSTYDSMYRAREVFQVKTAIIVTQEFHLPRALYIARSLGLDAKGVIADKREYIGKSYLNFREVFARTKAVVQLAVNDKPKYLGPVIPISGDGRLTKDTEI